MSTPKGPLHGVTIVDLTAFVMGPYATQIMGDLGAEIIKIETPDGDPHRRNGRPAATTNMGPGFMATNRNKRSVVLDLREAADKAQLCRLIAEADVFIHNIRADAIARLGFDYDVVAGLKPDIVYVHCVGYGSDGPYAGRQAFDDLIQAASGAADLMTRVDGNPDLRLPPSIIADKVSGLHAVHAAMAGLIHRLKTGEGQFIEVPMLECFTSFLMVEHLFGMTFDPPTSHVGDTRTLSADRQPYATKDGYIAILPPNRESSERFLALGGIENAYQSERFLAATTGREKVAVYYQMVREAAATHTTEEWLELCAQHNIPAMRANTLDSVFEDPHLSAVGFFELRTHESEGKWRAMKPPLRFSKTQASIRRDPPRLGQHTEEVLAEIGQHSIVK